MARCFGDGDALYSAYHDDEWGRPVTAEQAIFERLSLEGFQAGLSWITILRRREGFRAAFGQFDPERVSAFSERDVTRLLADEGIIRHRGKIEATISNAAVVLKLREQGRSLDELFLTYLQPPGSAPRSFRDVPSQTAASTALAKELKALGWRFCGPTTAYAAMQACGLVNDHLAGCPVRERTEAARQALWAR